MSKQKLKLNYDYDFIMVGISCYNRDYALCHAINNKLNIELKKEEDLIVVDSKTGQSSEFPLFSYEDEYNIIYHLIGNSGSKSLLIPEYDKFDFFLLIKNTNRDFNVSDLVAELKNIPIIVLLTKIIPDTLKSKQNLIFDL
jgi:hypothetical protein